MSRLLAAIMLCALMTSCKEGPVGPAGPQGEQGLQGTPGLPGPSVEDSLASFYESTLEAAKPINTFALTNPPSNPTATIVWSDLNTNYTMAWTVSDSFLKITLTYTDGYSADHYYPLALVRQMTIAVETDGSKTASLYY